MSGTRGSWLHYIHSLDAERNGCWCSVHFLIPSLGPSPQDGANHIKGVFSCLSETSLDMPTQAPSDMSPG